MAQQPFTSFGRQVASPRPSSPSFGFGSASRAQSARVHQPSLPGEDGSPRSPGPIYQLDSRGRGSGVSYTFGGGSPRFHDSDHRTVSPGPHNAYDPFSSLGRDEQRSNKMSPRRHGFGTATREHRAKVFITNAHHRAELYGRDSPGPSSPHIAMKGSFGVQHASTRSTAPGWVMGSGSNRFDSWEERRSRAQTAAPGSHELASSVGVQRDSRRPSSPQPSLSRARPETLAKVYLHSKDRTTLGQGSPGPSAHDPTRAFLASRPASAAFSFGTASRFPKVGANF